MTAFGRNKVGAQKMKGKNLEKITIVAGLVVIGKYSSIKMSPLYNSMKNYQTWVILLTLYSKLILQLLKY